jgi:SOS-response transcriptional repressor LexA
MASEHERREREERAARLKEARKKAGFDGPKSVSDRLGVNVNSYKAHEQGRNGFGLSDAQEYAKAFKVSLQWLNFGIGSPDDLPADSPAVAAPLISWVSAGALVQPDIPLDAEDAPIILEPGLDPNGDWIALRVDGDSMNRISPHESIIFVNRKDRRLVPNACYVIGDGEGGATYKRYRPPSSWEPVSTNPVHQPFVLKAGQEPDIIGRVRKTVLAM